MMLNIEEIKARAVHRQAFYHTLNATLKQDTDDIMFLLAEVERLRDELEQAKKHAENLRLDYVDLKSEVERLQKENQGLKAERDHLKAFCDEWCSGEDHFQEISSQLDCARIEIDSLRKERAVLKKALELACARIPERDCTHYPGYTCDNDFERDGVCAKCFADYFIQQAQEGSK